MKTGSRMTIVLVVILVLMSPFAHADDKNEKLLQAVKEGDTDKLKALIGKGADANAKDILGSPALIGAACAGHTEMVEALVSAGADVDAKGALVDSTALICASSEGHAETVKVLLAAGADVNAKNEYGQSALYLGAQGCHTESVKALLAAGADVNAKTMNGNTALRVAELMGCKKGVQLLKNGAVAASIGGKVYQAPVVVTPQPKESPERVKPDIVADAKSEKVYRAPVAVTSQPKKSPEKVKPEIVADAKSEKVYRAPVVVTPKPEKSPDKVKSEIVANDGSERTAAEGIPPVGTFTVNLASSRQKQGADRYVEKLKKQGVDAFSWEVNVPGKGRWYRVSSGRFSTRQEAVNYTKKLNQEGISGTFVTRIVELKSAGNTPKRILIKETSFMSEGLCLEGDLYLPETYQDGDKMPAVIVGGSWTTVKEQMAGTYARELAKTGFITLAFDHRFYGESEGEPRGYESPRHKIEDFKNALTYLQELPFVEKEKMGALGVCASSGYLANVAAEDNRLKATVLVAPWLHDAETVEVMYGGKEGVQKRIKAGLDAKNQYEQTGKVQYVPKISATDRNAAMFGEYDYYLNPKRGGIREWGKEFAVMSWPAWLEFNPMTTAKRIKSPVLIIQSEDAALPDTARAFYEDLAGKKEIYWMKGTQFDFYDGEEQIREAIERASEFFKENLTN
ncbi:MAG: ankyrin repeat domain-containing protein [Deltaproteobacteria bacterium]|nr:ankyrin repeat domain-containing protein [Deltaproteobacteria bacterium]